MGFMDYLVWGGITLVIGGSVGSGFAKLSQVYLKSQDKKKIVGVLEGKIPNTLKLDGELIQVDKFQYKKNDGEIVKVKLADITPKTSQKPLSKEKTSLFWELKNKFTRKKLAEFEYKKSDGDLVNVKVTEKPLKIPVPEEFSFKDKKGKKITLHAKKTKGKK